MALLHLEFESEYLGANTDVDIILPDKPRGITPKEFYGNEKKYRVLWLLHGTFGGYSDWVRKSNIELYACEKDLVVVMPGIGNADYSRWDNFTLGYDAENFLTEELMPLVYGWLPVSQKREDNFIAGLSMGGKGALQYAVNRPDLFAAAAVLSYIPKDIESQETEYRALYDKKASQVYQAGDVMHSMQRLYNTMHKYDSFEDYMDSSYNMFRLLKKADPSALPRLFFSLGTEDPLMSVADMEIFRDYLTSLGIEAQFVTGKGSHEWRVWERDIQKAFTFFGLDEETKGNAF
ncbi:MAG: alpha/beta hydrolase [Bulleidia sp.]